MEVLVPIITLVVGAIASGLITDYYHKKSLEEGLWKNDVLRTNLLIKYLEREAENTRVILRKKLIEEHKESNIEISEKFLDKVGFESKILYIDPDFDVVYRACPVCCSL